MMMLSSTHAGAFAVDEFEDKLKEVGSENLVALIKTVLSEWIFVSPIDSEKWSYFCKVCSRQH